MKMKRCIAFFLVLVLALALFSGCKGEESDSKSSKITTTTTTKKSTTTTTTTAPPIDTSGISPMLWRVSGENGEVLYLFGTIHVGDKRNLSVMDFISGVIESCDALAVEFDVVAYQKDMGAMIEDMSQYVYADGTNIKDHLSNDMYSQAVAMMKEAKLYSSMLDYYNVAMWYQYLDQAALTLYSYLVADYGMETLLLDKAYDDNMEILSVESGSFQMALLNSFSDELYLLLMQSLFDNADTYGDSLVELYTSWLGGNFEEFSALVLEEDYTDLTDEQVELVKDYNYELTDKRNLGMGDRAIEYLESGKTVFLAVGAAHMVGETGLVNRLAEEGYTVERIYFN